MESNNIKGTEYNDHIKRGLKELARSLKLKANKEKANYYSKFKLKVKPAKIASTLKPVSVKNKYRKFDNSTTSKSDGSYGPLGATGMDSSLGSGGTGESGGVIAGGFGVDSFGVTAFGEAINKTKSQYLEFVNTLNEQNEYNDSDTLESVVAGYKLLFDSIETNINVIMCGIQPSMVEFFGFSIDKLVFALNTFNGNILSLYLGGSSEIESLDIIKQWYLDIGVNQSTIDKITFIEKSNVIPDSSSLQYELIQSQNGLNSTETIDEFCDMVDSVIMLGCADVYFMGELMLSYTKLRKHIDIDTNFIFML